MTDYVEEQANEIEALQSIYSEEFTEIDNAPWTFEIVVKSENSLSKDDEEEKLVIKARFRLGPSYPDETPEILLSSESDLTEDELSTLKDRMIQEAGENVGVAMIFTLVSIAQEWLTSVIDDRINEWELEKQRKEEDEERRAMEEEARRRGTPVTVETFRQWKETFLRETRTLKDTGTERRLTGRQLFEKDSSMIDSDKAFQDEDEFEFVNEDAKNLSIEPTS
ncbi:RWD domain-containing protein 1-like [Oscarella lobularis]|uniref:RWD domain-containing protein 1-like n=1 Tax=Oscarella lobularis TaxID=121494 RepID=UPI00331404E4